MLRMNRLTLFLNFLTSMFHECDYIETQPIVPSIWEISIYTLNWNSETKIRRYLDNIKNRSTKFIGSFFTRELLSKDEHIFNELILLETFPSFVFDSRALIKAKVEGLYFFANTCDCRYMYNELMFSECYLIGATEYKLHSSNQMSIYDIVRSKASAQSNCAFAKFPGSFSAMDDLVSPSGHALRMYVEFERGNASICMFIFKILSNFFSTKTTRIVKPETYFPSNNKDSWLGLISNRFSMLKERLERSDDDIWHSVDEWSLGYISAGLLLECDMSVVREISSFIKRNVQCELKGREIFNFLQRGWSQGKGPAPRIPRHTMRNPIDNLYIRKIVASYKLLRSINANDYIRWILSANKNNKDKIWRLAVFSLGLDKSARDYMIHLSYIRTLSNLFPHHDASKRTLLELILNSVIIYSPNDAGWAKIPHLLSNDHHPEYHVYNRILPNLLTKIYSSNDFEEIYIDLLNASKLNKETSVSIEIPFTNYDEFAVDILARRWQLMFPFERAIKRTQLESVYQYGMKHKNIDITLLENSITKILRHRDIYLRRDVECNLRSEKLDIFP